MEVVPWRAGVEAVAADGGCAGEDDSVARAGLLVLEAGPFEQDFASGDADFLEDGLGYPADAVCHAEWA